MKALIIVDVQNDFLSGGSLAVPQGGHIIPVINQLQPKFDLVVATQDWHPVDHLSFASNHQNKVPFEVIGLYGLEQVLWPNHCVQGTEGAEFPSDLKTHRISAIFRKGMHKKVDSYSGFFDNGKKYDTGLAAYLKGLNVTKVYICGLAADYCVYFTAKDAKEMGFDTYFITDATKYINEGSYKRAITDLQSRSVHLVSVSDLM